MFAQAITSWADVEYWLLALFVELLGGNKAIAAKIYLSLDTTRAKSQALEQLVEEIGDDRQKAVTKAIVSISKSREKERDKLAHRVLGISNALEDALLLINPKSITVTAAVHYEEILVYRENDFKSVIEGNLKLSEYIKTLLRVLKDRQNNPDLLDTLHDSPEIQERLGPQGAANTA